jgi:hypothetical protein
MLWNETAKLERYPEYNCMQPENSKEIARGRGIPTADCGALPLACLRTCPAPKWIGKEIQA